MFTLPDLIPTASPKEKGGMQKTEQKEKGGKHGSDVCFGGTENLKTKKKDATAPPHPRPPEDHPQKWIPKTKHAYPDLFPDLFSDLF